MDWSGIEPHPWATVGTGKGGDYTWFDPKSGIGEAWGRHLPHWRQPGAIYFVTFRTVDSIPSSVLEIWTKERDDWLRQHPAPHDKPTEREYHRVFTERMHRFLDDCHGTCPMRDPQARRLVDEILRYADGASDGYALDAYAIMPNHLHVLVSPADGNDLSEVGKVWKRVTAHRINKLLGLHGAFWQQESWDHIVRSPEHLERYRRYFAKNPSHLPKVNPE